LDNTSAVGIVHQLLERAIVERASDIHLEPMDRGVRVRYRIDGILRYVASIPAWYESRVFTRIKVLAELDIGERRIPQDGKCVFTMLHGVVDVRVATFPSTYGEKIVLRILDKTYGIKPLENLGLSDVIVCALTQIVRRPQGLFLVTGPTGSGKTTTLYAIVLELARDEKNVVTLEDPVEYTIPGVTQAHIRPDIGFNFAEGIRSVLRQDPDIIMVGEIRDAETAYAAIRAALTGHLVVSSMHTTSAVGAITRLLDMGIEPFLLNAVLIGALAQRLVRVLCQSCKLLVGESLHGMVYEARGCAVCSHTGYMGRTGIFEYVSCNAAIRAAISRKAEYEDLRQMAVAAGMQSLADHGQDKVHAGITASQELLRVL